LYGVTELMIRIWAVWSNGVNDKIWAVWSNGVNDKDMGCME